MPLAREGSRQAEFDVRVPARSFDVHAAVRQPTGALGVCIQFCGAGKPELPLLGHWVKASSEDVEVGTVVVARARVVLGCSGLLKVDPGAVWGTPAEDVLALDGSFPNAIDDDAEIGGAVFIKRLHLGDPLLGPKVVLEVSLRNGSAQSDLQAERTADDAEEVVRGEPHLGKQW